MTTVEQYMNVKFLKNGNIDTDTIDGKMYFCFAEDEYPVIQKEYPELNKDQLESECLVRWQKLMESDYDRYKKYLENCKYYMRKMNIENSNKMNMIKDEIIELEKTIPELHQMFVKNSYHLLGLKVKLDKLLLENKMYNCFAEDEYPVIQKEYPEFNLDQLKSECEIRWNRLMDTDYDRYHNYKHICCEDIMNKK
jgi:hypothetical protein